MLLKQNLRIDRVLQITWKIDILMLFLCTAAYFIDTKLLYSVHIIPSIAALIGTAIAFFIAFNNNQAYSRWWEARIIWGGLVNDSRSWARNLLAYLPESDHHPTQTRGMILRHIGFLYALKSALRQIPDDTYQKYLSESDRSKLTGYSNIPNAILDLQAADLQLLSNQNKVDGFRFLALNDLIRSFCDGMGKSERINNTVFPTSYRYFTRLFIWMLVMITTMTLTESIGAWSIPFAWIVGFVFHISHINGMSLMNPFEYSPSAIPLNSITRNIEINLLQALGEANVPPPEAAMHDGEYIM